MTRLVLNWRPSIVRNSELTIVEVEATAPDAVPPSPYPSSCAGQMTLWKTMLSFPMK